MEKRSKGAIIEVEGGDKVVTEKIRRENFFSVEGRLLADGKHRQLTAEEWFYLYRRGVRDGLGDLKEEIFDSFEIQIRRQYPKLLTKIHVAAV